MGGSMSDEQDFFGVKPVQRTLFQEDVCKPGWVEAMPEPAAAPLFTPWHGIPDAGDPAPGPHDLPLLPIAGVALELRHLKAGEFFHELANPRRVYVCRGNGWYDSPGGYAGGPWHSYYLPVRRAQTPKGSCCAAWPDCDHGLTTD
jgi:hypothetical protein